jgi:hypothetical protein
MRSLATGGGRRYCRRRAALLPAVGGVAANGKKPCYRRRARLLPTAGSLATGGGRHCCRQQEAWLPAVGGVAANASSLATKGVDVVQVMLRQDLAGAGW